MANSNYGTIVATGAATAVTCDKGGMWAADLVWTAGTATIALQTSIDGGTTWVTAENQLGVIQSADMATGNPHAQLAVYAAAGQRLRLNATGASSANVQHDLRRVSAL